MNDSRDFQDAESVRRGHSHVASQLVSFPPHPVPGGMLSRSIFVYFFGHYQPGIRVFEFPLDSQRGFAPFVGPGES